MKVLNHEVLGMAQHSGREIYIVKSTNEAGDDSCTMMYYKSSGTAIKDGKLWGGRVFPIIGVVGFEHTESMDAVRKEIWGKSFYSTSFPGWICKSPWFKDEFGQNFGILDYMLASKWLEEQSDECSRVSLSSLVQDNYEALESNYKKLHSQIVKMKEAKS